MKILSRWWVTVLAGLTVSLAVAGSVQLYLASHVYTPARAYPRKLRTPRILDKRDRTMFVVRTDDRKKATRFLFNAVQAIRLSEKTPVRPSRLRKRGDRFGVDAPDDVMKKTFSRTYEIGGLTLEVEAWPYGQCAELLHVGSYDTLPEAHDQLDTFIQQQGYTRVGDIEEEYVLTPSPLRSSAHLQTIVRARIQPL